MPQTGTSVNIIGAINVLILRLFVPIRVAEKINWPEIAPDLGLPVLYNIRQGASMISYGLVEAIDAT